MPVPNTFANATTSIPLSQLDANFATAITLGNTAIQLGNTVTTLNNMTFANVTVSSGSVTVANVTVTGVGTFAAGSNTAPSITTSGDTNTGFFFPAADTVATTTGGTERMRVDSSGNVGIGTSSPGEKLNVSTGVAEYAIQWNSTGSNNWVLASATNRAYIANKTTPAEVLTITNGGNVGIGTSSPTGKLHAVLSTSYSPGSSWSSSTAVFGGSTSVSGAFGIAYDDTNGAGLASIIPGTSYKPIYTNCSEFIVKTNGTTERARIDSSGNLLVGTTSTLFASSHAFVNSGTAVLGLRNSVATAGKYWQVGPDSNSSFKVYNQSSVGMFLADGSTSWASSSDERQKNIIEPISNAVAKVGSLRAVIGSYKSDQENKRRSFLIAQDVEQALPEAVTTAPDGFLGVAYTDVIPLLVAAIQELKAEFDAYKAAHS